MIDDIIPYYERHLREQTFSSYMNLLASHKIMIIFNKTFPLERTAFFKLQKKSVFIPIFGQINWMLKKTSQSRFYWETYSWGR